MRARTAWCLVMLISAVVLVGAIVGFPDHPHTMPVAFGFGVAACFAAKRVEAIDEGRE